MKEEPYNDTLNITDPFLCFTVTVREVKALLKCFEMTEIFMR